MLDSLRKCPRHVRSYRLGEWKLSKKVMDMVNKQVNHQRASFASPCKRSARIKVSTEAHSGNIARQASLSGALGLLAILTKRSSRAGKPPSV